MNDMPWIKSYPPGVRWDINITPTPVQKILDDTIAKWPDRFQRGLPPSSNRLVDIKEFVEQDREAPAVDHGMMYAPDELVHILSELDESQP